jgi:hypothetical protein
MPRCHYQFFVPQTSPNPTADARTLKRRRGLVRALAACWLVAFAAFNVGIPLLDARMEHTAEVVVHWEDAGATSCPVAHAPDCVACQVVTSARSLTSARPVLAIAMDRAADAPPETATTVRAMPARAVPSTRAPPRA